VLLASGGDVLNLPGHVFHFPECNKCNVFAQATFVYLVRLFLSACYCNIVYYILHLQVTSKPEEPSAFLIFIPLSAQSADGFSPEVTGMMVPLTVPGDTEKMPGINLIKTIVFADDNETFQRPVAAMLRKSGYSVITASDGEDALQKAREFVGSIHLLLADIDMPRMTGIELAIQINRERPDMKILLISGLDSESLVRGHGWQFLRKPIKFEILREKIRRLLSEQPPTKEHLLDA
jgi:CheY-like chemotaxis protein